MLVFDVETDGLLPTVSVIHCLVTHDTATGERTRYNNQRNGHASIEEGLRRLASADHICGHNIVGYDLPVIAKLYPQFSPKGRVTDTIVLSSLAYPDIKERDFAAERKRGTWIPKQFYGRHSLEAWGHRLGEYKGDFKGPWDSWTQEMEDYCDQDVTVTVKLADKLLALPLSAESIELEHNVARIIQRQVARGFALNEKAAAELHSKLVARQLEIVEELKRKYFHPFYLRGAEFTPKKDNKKQGYTAGVSFCKVKLTEFNPGSRDHIANRLIQLYGWKPKAWTTEGKPQVDEAILESLTYPPCALLNEYLTVAKRLGQLIEGREAILKNVRNGRVHGNVRTNAAVTGRMTHANPNVAQTPRVGTLYGEEFRALYVPGAGYVLVGCDADGLELRCLAHYMARYDGGAYIETVINGKKEDKTDVHSVTQRALGFNSRDNAKTWMYAFLYGAGDEKLGRIALDDMGSEARQQHKGRKVIAKLGKHTRDQIAKNLPALSKLVKAVRKSSKQRGYLVGLDGRRLTVRSEHSALNTLLQSAGALLMKRALVLLDAEASQRFKTGVDYEFVANIHDEIQAEVKPEMAEDFGREAAASIRRSGEHFKFRCPLSGSYAVGDSWAKTH